MPALDHCHLTLWLVVALLYEQAGRSPLGLALGAGHEEVAVALLEKGADVQWRDAEVVGPLLIQHTILSL